MTIYQNYIEESPAARGEVERSPYHADHGHLNGGAGEAEPAAVVPSRDGGGVR